MFILLYVLAFVAYVVGIVCTISIVGTWVDGFKSGQDYSWMKRLAPVIIFLFITGTVSIDLALDADPEETSMFEDTEEQTDAKCFSAEEVVEICKEKEEEILDEKANEKF